MSPGTKETQKVRHCFLPYGVKESCSLYLHVCCAAVRIERLKKWRNHFPEVRKEQLL